MDNLPAVAAAASSSENPNAITSKIVEDLASLIAAPESATIKSSAEAEQPAPSTDSAAPVASTSVPESQSGSATEATPDLKNNSTAADSPAQPVLPAETTVSQTLISSTVGDVQTPQAAVTPNQEVVPAVNATAASEANASVKPIEEPPASQTTAPEP